MMNIPPDPLGMDSEAEDELDDEDEDEDKDVRYTQYRRDKVIAEEDGYASDSDDEDERPRRNIADYRRTPSPVENENRAEDTEEVANQSAEDDTTGLEIEVEVPVEKGPELADSGLEVNITQKHALGETEEEASPQNPTLGSSADLTPEETSDTSELQGDTVMVDAPPVAEETPPKTPSP
jgi:histone deacetylase 1/2